MISSTEGEGCGSVEREPSAEEIAAVSFISLFIMSAIKDELESNPITLEQAKFLMGEK